VHKPKGGHKGGKRTNYVPKPTPLVTISIGEREREGKLKSIVSLEESSPAMMMCLNIEVTCTPYKTINILCL
jgi:hypothetical protein